MTAPLTKAGIAPVSQRGFIFAPACMSTALQAALGRQGPRQTAGLSTELLGGTGMSFRLAESREVSVTVL